MANKAGCPEGCGVCDHCGSSVCKSGNGLRDSLKQLDELMERLEAEDNDDGYDDELECDIDVSTFVALADFVGCLKKYVDLQLDPLGETTAKLVADIVDSAIVVSLIDRAARNGRVM